MQRRHESVGRRGCRCEAASDPRCVAWFVLLLPVSDVYHTEKLRHDPWKLLAAVMLLNMTTGRQAIPIFWRLMDRWPTPECMSCGEQTYVSLSHLVLTPYLASEDDLRALLQPLGLAKKRARRLIDLSAQYLQDPPSTDHPHKSRNYRVPTPVSHLPGCGPYALDSYRIFCGPLDEWKRVRPSDKELIRYLVSLTSYLRGSPSDFIARVAVAMGVRIGETMDT